MNTQKLKILIPVDFSKESIEGMNTGLEISRMTNGKVVLFNVVTELTHMMEHYYQDFKNISKAFKSGEKELMEDQEMVVLTCPI
jgi:nucleotide-binding universal stress UspA family protein